MDKIKVGIIGYGNLGRGVECAVSSAPDMEVIGVFTRRSPDTVKTAAGAKVYPVTELNAFVGKADVMVLCGGSATDLPEQTKEYIKYFNN